jgi:hypothetical protein
MRLMVLLLTVGLAEKITIRIRSLEISKSDKTSLALVQVTGGVTLALEIHLGL